jgi:hypothetical protein
MDCAPLINYLQVVEREFSGLRMAAQSPSPLDDPKFRQIFLSSIANLENSPEFAELSKHTLKEFNKDKSFASIWQHHITTFFRWSGLYERIFEGAGINREEICSLYAKEITAESGQWVCLAPIELVEFPEQPLKFDDFAIQSFTAEELKSLLKQRTCKLFYPWAEVDTYRLSQFWMIVCTEEKPISHSGLLVWGEKIKPKYSPFSGKLKNAFRILSLYKWRDQYSPDENLLLSDDAGLLSLNICPSLPFTIQIPQGFLDNPPAAPDLSDLPMEPTMDNFGEEVGEHPYVAFDLSGSETEFRDFVKNINPLVEKIKQVPQWQFIDVALSFMEKGFSDSGLEQLLWHITAVEALMGEDKSGLTSLLKKRVSYILGNTEAETAKIKKVFQKLYDLRSEFIHGNEKLLDPKVVHHDLAQAREMARQTALWMLSYLNHVLSECEKNKAELPTRDNLLAVLNLDEKSRTQTANILACLPSTFPRVPSW